MNIVIIEDEQHTANDLAQTIQKVVPDANITAILKSVNESVSFFGSTTNLMEECKLATKKSDVFRTII